MSKHTKRKGTLVVPSTFTRYTKGQVVIQAHVLQPGTRAIKLDRWAVQISRDFYDQVFASMLEGIEELERCCLTDTGERLTVEDFHGKDIWRELGKENAKIAGRCVAHMVRNGLLPLQRDFSKTGKAHYIIDLNLRRL